jgi:adenylylsulfate kinase-like enzyme
MIREILGTESVIENVQRIVVITGLSGAGKTQLAIKFAMEFGHR